MQKHAIFYCHAFVGNEAIAPVSLANSMLDDATWLRTSTVLGLGE